MHWYLQLIHEQRSCSRLEEGISKKLNSKYTAYITAQSESDMALCSCIHNHSFTRVNTFEQLSWVTFFLKVDQIFVIAENSHVCEGAPSTLNLLNSHDFLTFLRYFLFSLQKTSPSPLNLNCCNVIHSETMIFKQSPCECHLISSLD